MFGWYERTATEGLAGAGAAFIEPVGAWGVHRYDEVERILTTPSVFSSDELRYSAQPVPHQENPVLSSLLATDPPRHHELRRIVSQAFTPRTVEGLRASVEKSVHTRLADAPFELISTLAHPLPLETIASLLGVEAQAEFIRWTDAITTFLGTFAADPARQKAFDDALAELDDYFRDVLASRRARPGEDVISTLVASGLGDDDLVNFCALLLLNGHETTKTLLVHTVLCLAAFPDARESPGLIDEVLRFLPPVGGTDRFTTTATEIDGHAVDAGTRVIVMMLSANRDPRVFEEPHRFLPGRTPNKHLSFGRGVHFCLGAHLARLQAGLAVRALLDRFPGEWGVTGLALDRTPVGIDITALTLDVR